MELATGGVVGIDENLILSSITVGIIFLITTYGFLLRNSPPCIRRKENVLI